MIWGVFPYFWKTPICTNDSCYSCIALAYTHQRHTCSSTDGFSPLPSPSTYVPMTTPLSYVQPQQPGKEKQDSSSVHFGVGSKFGYISSFGAPDLFMAYHFNFFILGRSNRVKPHPFQISLEDIILFYTERLMGIAIMDLLQPLITIQIYCKISYTNP